MCALFSPEILQAGAVKGLRASNFALLKVVFKWHHGSEGVKDSSKSSLEGRETPCLRQSDHVGN